MKNTKSKLARAFQIALFAVSVGMLVYFCVSGNNFMLLLQTLPTLNFFWLFCALATVGAGWLLDSLVIQCLAAQAYSEGYRLKNAFRVTMVGLYFNAITPYGSAGQPMQLLSLTRQGVSSGIALSVLVRKFLVYHTTIAAYSLLVIVLKYSFFRSEIPGFMALAFVGFLCQAGTVLLVFFFSHNRTITTRLINGVMWLLNRLRLIKNPEETGKKVSDQLAFYMENNRAMHQNRRMTLRVYAYTVLQLTATFIVPFLLFKAFHGEGMPVSSMIAAQSFVTMISSYMPLPGAAGAAEGSFLIIFRLFFEEGAIRQAMLLWRFITYYSSILIGSFFAGIGDKKTPYSPRVCAAGTKGESQ